MILGLGVDLCDIQRVERTLARFGDRFVRRVYGAGERERAERRQHQRAHAYALRYAAKEACAKALGTGFRQGVFHRDIVVESLPSGKPTLVLSGGARRRLEAMTPPGMRAEVEVSLSDEYPMAEAVVIISAVPAG